MVTVLVNGIRYQVPSGGMLLGALAAAGVHVPAMCDDDRIAPSGACRLCLVRVKGLPRPVTACTTPLADGLEVETDSLELETVRHSLLEMLVRRYPAGAIGQFPDKPFHRAIRDAGLVERAHHGAASSATDRSHPYISVDMSRCIDCYRCVRICEELQGQSVWHVRDRGTHTRVVPDAPTLGASTCVSCGACVDTCPTGALDDRDADVLSAPAAWTRTVCPYCGVGCELLVGTRERRIVSVRPALDAPVNKGHLCVKGRYGSGFVAAPDRMTEPMLRENGTWRRVSWSEARAVVAARLRTLIDRRGPDAIGVLGSARATNEDNYVIQKLARAAIGTNNVDCCARVCHAPSAAALKAAFGAGLATNSFDDIELARAILVCGANVTESHPVIGARIRRAARRGAALVVIDPRRTELARDADVHLAIRPGTNVAALNGIAHVIVREGLCDRPFIGERATGFDEFAAFVDGWPPERAAALCGVDPGEIRRAAHIYAGQGPAMSVHGLGLTEHGQGTDGVAALINLAVLTGNVGKPGAGVNPLRGQNNVQGAAHMGCDPAVLPGSTPIDSGRGAFGRRWGVEMPHTRGLDMLGMMDAALDGRLAALWCAGYDVLATNPNASITARALQSIELIVVQDLFLTETAREYASVFLPACSTFEKDGTFMNAERRIQRVRAALPPAGSSKPDWQIVAEIARAMGAPGFEYRNAEDIWNEVRALCDGARGMSYARLEARGLQWPCPDETHPGTTLLHRERGALDRPVPLRCIEFRPTPENASESFPFELITGRTLYQFNTGTMTRRTRNNELRPTDTLDVGPRDAARLGLADGDRVRVTSRYGTAILPVRVTEAVGNGQAFATFHDPAVGLNAVTGPHRDGVTGTPEYKITAVRIEHLE